MIGKNNLKFLNTSKDVTKYNNAKGLNIQSFISAFVTYYCNYAVRTNIRLYNIFIKIWQRI